MEHNVKNTPKVCVRSITYNHAPYIVETMDGFCMQQTNFPYVCTILDDCSTDGEQEVIRKYLQEHFDLADQSVVRNEETDDYTLTYACHKENRNCFFAVLFLKYNHYSIGKGSRKNGYIKEWLDQVKYIALCEGDDYWTDPLKLQKQVDYFELNPKCGLIYTDFDILYQNNNRIEKNLIKSGRYPQIRSFEDHLLKAAYIAPPSWLYRSESKAFEEYKNSIGFIDGSFFLALEFFKNSEVHFLEDTTCVYRVLEESASHHKSHYKKYIYAKNVFEEQLFFCRKYDVSSEITNAIENHFYRKYYGQIISYENGIEKQKLFEASKSFKNGNLKSHIISLLLANRLTIFFLSLAYKFKYRKI